MDTRRTPLYEQVADRVEEMVVQGVYEPGERLPSIRELHALFSVSVNTAREAYQLLESRGVVEPRNHSGHYVLQGPPLCTDCDMDFPDLPAALPRDVAPDSLTRQVLAEGAQPGWVNLTTAEPAARLLPTKRLGDLTARAVRRDPAAAMRYSLPPGSEPLRQEIAKRVFRGGVAVSPEQVLVTAGCQEAVFLALMTVCKPGDSVVIESPGFFLFYQLLERLGLRAVEVPSRPVTGVDPDELEFVLRRATTAGGEHKPVRAAVLIPNFSNPVGALMPDENKQRIAAMLDRYGVYLIEDDMYGEMAWNVERPRSMTSWANPERTLLCASFSKTIAPGYRIGYLVSGKELFQRAVHSKLVTSAAVSGPAALGITAFVAGGGYDRWLRTARSHYRETVTKMRQVIHESFPEGTRSSRPAGGLVLWVVLPQGFDVIDLYNRAREERIAFAPGPIFSLGDCYRNCLRLNAANWSAEIERAVQRIGELAGELSQARRARSRNRRAVSA